MNPEDNQRAKTCKVNLMTMSKSVQTDPIIVTSPRNRLNTVEKLNKFFMEVYEKEKEANKVNEATVLRTLSKLPSMSGSKVSERCLYMYCYATCHTWLVKDCVTRFLKEYSYSAGLIKSWKSTLNISSLSFGPGIECLAFNIAVLEVSQDLNLVSEVSIITTCSSKWLNTVKVLSKVLQEVKTPLNIHFNPKKVPLNKLYKPSKAKFVRFLRNSNIVLMFKTLNLDQLKTNKFFETMKSGALLFSINSPSLSSVLQGILEKHQGTFLYGPVTVTSNELMVEISENSMETVPSTTFEFFVWVKDFDPVASDKCLEKLPPPTNIPNEDANSGDGDPPKKIKILRNGLKRVEMFYSFYACQNPNSKGTQTDLVSDVILENKLNTNRLVTDFFMEVFKREKAQFFIRESIDLLLNFPELSSISADFDNPKIRCAYMYYYASCHTLLMKECMVRFLTDYPKASSLLTKWRSNPNHCSLSHGPGLDYIAFSLAILEVSKQPTAITDARIVTYWKGWKFTVDVLSEVIQGVKTPLNLNFEKKLTQYQDLDKEWKKKAIKLLKNSSLVFMFKTLNFGEKETRKCPPPLLLDVVGFLSPGTLIFFMDSASSLSAMKMVLGCFDGTFLHGPTVVSSRELQIDVSEELLKSMQLIPAQDAEVEFFVWEKVSNAFTPFEELDRQYLDLQSKSPEKIRPGSVTLKPLCESSLLFYPKSAEKGIEVPSQTQIIDSLTLIFIKVYEIEISQYRANQSLPLSTIFKIPSNLHANYNATCIRCAYMYLYGTRHTMLIKDCIARFLTDCSKAGELLRGWQSNSNYCSLSIGPGLDYLAFSLAVLEHTKQPMIVAKTHIITKCIGWKNTFEILSDVMQYDKTLPYLLDLGSSTISAGSVFEPWDSKAIDCLLGANVILMFKALDLDKKGEKVHPPFIRELVNILNVGTVIFFIDTSRSSKIMQEALTKHHGSFVYGPISVPCTKIPVETPAELQKVMELLPAQSATMDFFVWQKSSNAPILSQSLQNLKMNSNLMPIQSNSLEDCSSSKLTFPKQSTLKSEGIQVLSSDSEASSCSPAVLPTPTWRVKQKSSEKSTVIKVGNKNKILEHLGSQKSDVSKRDVSSDQESTSSSDSDFDLCDEEEPVISKSFVKSKEIKKPSSEPESAQVAENSSELGTQKLRIVPTGGKSTSIQESYIRKSSSPKVKPVLSKTIMELKKLIESSSEPDDPKHMIAPVDDKSPTTPLNYRDSKLSQVSKHLSVMKQTRETLPGIQVDKINSLIANIESICKFESNKVVADSFEPDVPNTKTNQLTMITLPNSADTELPLVSKSLSMTGHTNETVSDDQADKIKSLIQRINWMSCSIENDLSASNPLSVNEHTTNSTEVNALTKRINKLVTSLESNISNRNQSSESIDHKFNCCYSCKTHCFSCHKYCDLSEQNSKPKLNLNSSDYVSAEEETDSKPDEGGIQRDLCSNCQTAYRCHCVEACLHQPSIPSIVIPLENINPDLLFLILSSKK